MAKVRFNIHERRTIRLVIRLPLGKFVFYTGIHITPADWNPVRQEVRRGHLQGANINAALHRLRAEVERLYLDSIGKGLPLLPSELKVYLDKFWRGKEPIKKIDTAAEYTRKLASDRLKSGQIRVSTSKALNSLASALDRFNPDIKLSDIGMAFHQEFTAFLISEKKSPNTIAGIIKRLKRVMAIALDNGDTDNQAFRSARFRAPEMEVETIYLTQHEVDAIAGLELTGHYARVRDSFLLGVYTGLRYSDFSDLSPMDFQTHKGVFMVKKRMVKTNRVIAVPINNAARAILERYDFAPPNIGNQVMNKYLKRICRQAGISEEVKTEPMRGGVRSVVVRYKWQMVSTHTARRTFATLAFLRHAEQGLPIDGIMDITGHKSRVDFMRYIKVGVEERAAIWAGGQSEMG